MLAGSSLIWPKKPNHEQLGQLWTHHSNLTQLGILITLRYLTQDKKLTNTEVVTFWLLFLNGSSQNLKNQPQTSCGDMAPCDTISKHFLTFHSSYRPEIRKKYLLMSPFWPLIITVLTWLKLQPQKAILSFCGMAPCSKRYMRSIHFYKRVIIQTKEKYNENEYSRYVKETTTSSGWKMSAKCHPWVFSEWCGNSHTTGHAAAGLKANIIHRYSKIVATIYSSNIKVNWKWKQDNTYSGQKFHFKGQAKNASGLNLKVLWSDHNPPPFKSGHCGKNITQLNIPKN